MQEHSWNQPIASDGNTAVFVNPGTGSIDDPNCNIENAIQNIKKFAEECAGQEKRWERAKEKDYGDGRYAFDLWLDQMHYEIQMPGLPLEMVRYMDEENQNIWNFPRLYVDDSRWVWSFALIKDSELQERKDDNAEKKGGE